MPSNDYFEDYSDGSNGMSDKAFRILTNSNTTTTNTTSTIDNPSIVAKFTSTNNSNLVVNSPKILPKSSTSSSNNVVSPTIKSPTKSLNNTSDTSFLGSTATSLVNKSINNLLTGNKTTTEQATEKFKNAGINALTSYFSNKNSSIEDTVKKTLNNKDLLSTVSQLGVSALDKNGNISKAASQVREFQSKYSKELQLAENIFKSTVGEKLLVKDSSGNTNYVGTVGSLLGLGGSSSSSNSISKAVNSTIGSLFGGSSSISKAPNVTINGVTQSSGPVRSPAADYTKLVQQNNSTFEELVNNVKTNSDNPFKGRITLYPENSSYFTKGGVVTDYEAMRDVEFHTGQCFAITVEPYLPGTVASTTIPQSPYYDVFPNNWIPVTDFSLELGEMTTTSIDSIPEVPLIFPIGEKLIMELSTTILEDNTFRVFKYITDYKNAMIKGKRSVLPYQDCSSLITVYVYNRQLLVLRKVQLIGFPDCRRSLEGTDGANIKTYSINWIITGELTNI